jgi:uncharacterized protein YgbK (DUF1537 family)
MRKGEDQMNDNTYIVGYCCITAEGMIGPTVETEMQAIEEFMVEYPAVPERDIWVQPITATYDPDEAGDD